MIKAQVLTPWLGTGGSGDTQMPQMLAEYGPNSEAENKIVSCSVLSGQLTSNVREMLLGAFIPNLTTVEILCESATLADIEANATYQVLESEEIAER